VRKWLTRLVADRRIAAGNRAERKGDLAAASRCYRRAVDGAPYYARAHLNLGIGLEASGDFDAARGCYEQALRLDPGNPYAHYNLGKLLDRRGDAAEAKRHLAASLERKPDFLEARLLLAHVLDREGDAAAAARELDAALRARPENFAALFSHALVLVKLGRHRDAESSLRQALVVEPGNADASIRLAGLLCSRGLLDEAEGFLRGVVASEPGRVEAHYGLFDIHKRRGELSAAASELRQVIASAPALLPAYGELAAILLRQGRVDEALQVHAEARRRSPATGQVESNESLVLASNELFALNLSDSITEEDLFARHRSLGARLESRYPRRFARFANAAQPGRRLRVGYVSGEFRYHPVTVFAIPLLERHDRSQCEVYCYSRGAEDDEFTRQVSQCADAWRDVASLPAARIADLIHGDGIDLLVDLSGHSGVGSLEVFALQPAPVQASWLGYLNTTGMTRVHYRICDPHTDPPGLTDGFHTETLVRLPRSQWCYRPFVTLEPAGEPPSATSGRITFGSFTQIAKLSPSTRRLWTEILRRVPDSRLVILGAPDAETKAALAGGFVANGIDAARIEVLGYVGLQQYFRSFDAVDIALDPSPYSGGTTTCDALWMGVPVITAPGRRPASRSAASILANVGLADCIAPDAAGYVDLAIRFARERGRIAELRRTLRARMRASPLMDEARFARDMEAAYRRMWLDWCEGRRAAPLHA